MSSLLIPVPEPTHLTISEKHPVPMDLKALTHPTRWRLLWILERREHRLCVQELAVQIGQFSQPTISYHLRCLRKAGFVECQKQDTHVYYFLRRDRLREVSEALAQLGREDREILVSSE
jgi:DNA-binding transcriptional ArsR family regulator